MTWTHFLPFSIAAVLLWTAGAAVALLHREKASSASLWLTGTGIIIYCVFVAGLWVGLERPPLRTLGETRLWYSLFMVVSGWLVYRRWGYCWLPLFSGVVATVFIVINLLRPEIHDQSLMPALQSAWFVPHVTVYMFSYSLFGCAFLLAVAGLWQGKAAYLPSTDALVRIGLAFLTFGMLSGCFWAKQAWGHYWSWDPKETWAAATWAVYLAYLHCRLRPATGPVAHRLPYACLIIGFLLLQMCWYGVNYLPAAAESMHSYME